jgi:sensor histidine kinase YesM
MTQRRTVWMFAALFWGLFGLVSGFQVWVSMITHGHSVPRLIGYHLVIWEGWLLASVAIFWLARRWPVVPPQRLNILVHILAACVIGLLHSFFWLALLVLVRPFDPMSTEPSQLNITRILFYRMPLEWTLYCLVLGSALAFDYYNRYREREVEAANLSASLADARLHALELQIQPHFLFNTMNAISSLVRSRRNDEAVEMMAGLSELLRYTLDHAGDQRVPLDAELSVLQRYLEIQHARFPDRMSFRIDATAEARRAAVPSLLLQPLAENAIRHGIDRSASGGVIEVRATRVEDRLKIELFNSGALDQHSERGIGLSNTIARLQHIYGAAGTFDLEEARGGVLASLSLPWSEVA